MTKTPRWLCATLVVLLALTGPLAVMLTPAPAGAQTSQQAAMAEPAPSLEPTDGDRAGAVAVNFVYVPGKLILCTIGTVATTVLLFMTFGTGYRAAKSVFDEGCGGSWIVTPEHMSGKVPPRELPTSPSQ